MNIPTLLASLNAHEVVYVVIGATAFPHHGYARATLDVDILIEPTAENAARIRAALIDYGFDLSDAGTATTRDGDDALADALAALRADAAVSGRILGV